MMPGVQELKQCRTLDQNKHTLVRCLINSIISHFHAFCIDKCVFCLQMPSEFSDSKKIFMFASQARSQGGSGDSIEPPRKYHISTAHYSNIASKAVSL